MVAKERDLTTGLVAQKRGTRTVKSPSEKNFYRRYFYMESRGLLKTCQPTAHSILRYSIKSVKGPTDVLRQALGRILRFADNQSAYWEYWRQVSIPYSETPKSKNIVSNNTDGLFSTEIRATEELPIR